MKVQIYAVLFALSMLSVGVLAQVYSLWRFIKYLRPFRPREIKYSVAMPAKI